MRVSFLIPAFDERATIVEVLDRIEALELDRQLIVVDDGSTDGTTELLREWQQGREGVVLLRQENAGKGAAIRAAIPLGSRLSGGRPQRAYLFWHLVGNRFLSLLTGLLYNTTLSDMETGYKAFRTDVLQSLDLRQSDFSIEPEITAKVCKRKLRVYQLPISYYGRTYAEGKKITWRDGFKAIWVLVRVRFER